MSRVSSCFVVAAAAAAIVLGASAQADAVVRAGSCGARSLLGGGPQLRFVGLTADQHLVIFGECNPSRPRDLGAVAGLTGGDSALIGIDYRVQNGALYGVGNGGGVYRFDVPGSPVATLVNQLTVALDPAATAFGVDFNPAADRLRIVSDTGQNLRHNVNDGGTTIADGTLNYIEGTPPAPVTALGITATAYTNNDLDPDTATSLFDVDGTRDQVVLQSPPNGGVVAATGKLGVDASGPIGFDVYSTLRDGTTLRNAGFAAIPADGTTGFYRVDLLTGAAVRIGTLGASVVDIAAPPQQ
jgi:hypothetical protein